MQHGCLVIPVPLGRLWHRAGGIQIRLRQGTVLTDGLCEYKVRLHYLHRRLPIRTQITFYAEITQVAC